jgi:hypothetical protein
VRLAHARDRATQVRSRIGIEADYSS